MDIMRSWLPPATRRRKTAYTIRLMCCLFSPSEMKSRRVVFVQVVSGVVGRRTIGSFCNFGITTMSLLLLFHKTAQVSSSLTREELKRVAGTFRSTCNLSVLPHLAVSLCASAAATCCARALSLSVLAELNS